VVRFGNAKERDQGQAKGLLVHTLKEREKTTFFLRLLLLLFFY
jgi:hypothetical protein